MAFRSPQPWPPLIGNVALNSSIMRKSDKSYTFTDRVIWIIVVDKLELELNGNILSFWQVTNIKEQIDR